VAERDREGWQAKLLGHAEGRTSSFWATQSRLPFGLHGVEEFVFAMPAEVVSAARHWPAKELALKVLYRVSTGVLRGLDRIAEDDLAVVADSDITALIQLVAAEPTCGHDHVCHVPLFLIVAVGSLLDVRCDEELDLKNSAAQVTQSGRALNNALRR